MTPRDVLKTIMRTELPFTFGKGAVDAIIGLLDIDYNYNTLTDNRVTNLENNETIK